METTILVVLGLAVSLIIPAVAAIFTLTVNAWAISMYRRKRPIVGQLCAIIAILVVGARFSGITALATANAFGYGDLILAAVCAWWATYTMVRYHGAQQRAPVNIKHRKAEA